MKPTTHTSFEKNHMRRLMSGFEGIPEDRIKMETRFCRKCVHFRPPHPQAHPDAGVCKRFTTNAKPTGYAKYDTKIGTCFTSKKTI